METELGRPYDLRETEMSASLGPGGLAVRPILSL